MAFGVTLSALYFGVGLDQIFTNFGPGIVAETFANGGYTAIVIFSIFFGFLIGRADKIIENNRYNWNYVLFAIILYPSLFFVVRGDFLNSFYEFYSKSVVVFLIILVTGARASLAGPRFSSTNRLSRL